MFPISDNKIPQTPNPSEPYLVIVRRRIAEMAEAARVKVETARIEVTRAEDEAEDARFEAARIEDIQNRAARIANAEGLERAEAVHYIKVYTARADYSACPLWASFYRNCAAETAKAVYDEAKVARDEAKVARAEAETARIEAEVARAEAEAARAEVIRADVKVARAEAEARRAEVALGENDDSTVLSDDSDDDDSTEAKRYKADRRLAVRMQTARAIDAANHKARRIARGFTAEELLARNGAEMIRARVAREVYLERANEIACAAAQMQEHARVQGSGSAIATPVAESSGVG